MMTNFNLKDEVESEINILKGFTKMAFDMSSYRATVQAIASCDDLKKKLTEALKQHPAYVEEQDEPECSGKCGLMISGWDTNCDDCNDRHRSVRKSIKRLKLVKNELLDDLKELAEA